MRVLYHTAQSTGEAGSAAGGRNRGTTSDPGRTTEKREPDDDDVPMKTITVLTPCYNEEAGIRECYEAVRDYFEANLAGYALEHLFIDNASTDGTVAILKEIAAHDEHVKIIVNSRNFGLSRSPYYGMMQATGDAVVPLVADLQTPVECIGSFVEVVGAGLPHGHRRAQGRQGGPDAQGGAPDVLLRSSGACRTSSRSATSSGSASSTADRRDPAPLDDPSAVLPRDGDGDRLRQGVRRVRAAGPQSTGSRVTASSTCSTSPCWASPATRAFRCAS